MSNNSERRSIRPVAIDLYAGGGGLSQGLREAGFKVIAAVEIDELAVETYRKNHRRVRMWDRDITRLSPKKVRQALRLKKGELDLLAGCPPCQGFSSMRTLNGGREINDPQNDLVFDFLRFIEEFEPKAIMMENVPGLYHDRRMSQIKRSLRRLGYRFKCKILDAADYEVPQRRRRMILVAYRRGWAKLACVRPQRRNVEDAISELPEPHLSTDPLHNFPEKRSQKVMQLIRSIPPNGGSRKDLGEEAQLECHKKCNGFKDVYGRMAWKAVAPTITTGCFNPSKGRFLHPVQHRNITLREAALLQSFPKSYYFSLRRGKSNAAVLIGNALPPVFIKHHAKRIRKSLRVCRTI